LTGNESQGRKKILDASKTCTVGRKRFFSFDKLFCFVLNQTMMMAGCKRKFTLGKLLEPWWQYS
jgi:hypothetical protein